MGGSIIGRGLTSSLFGTTAEEVVKYFTHRTEPVDETEARYPAGTLRESGEGTTSTSSAQGESAGAAAARRRARAARSEQLAGGRVFSP